MTVRNRPQTPPYHDRVFYREAEKPALISSQNIDWLKIIAIIFFGGVFWNQFNTSQATTTQRFYDFKKAAEQRDERMEKQQEQLNVLVNQLTEIKGDMKSLSAGVQDIKQSIMSKPVEAETKGK